VVVAGQNVLLQHSAKVKILHGVSQKNRSVTEILISLKTCQGEMQAVLPGIMKFLAFVACAPAF